jgi:hypothetical protein
MIKPKRMKWAGQVARMVKSVIYAGFRWKARRKETIRLDVGGRIILKSIIEFGSQTWSHIRAENVMILQS